LDSELFPLAQYWWAYVAFTGFIALLLALDLGVFNRKPHAISLREASIWTGVWFLLAVLFNWTLWAWVGFKFGHETAGVVALEFAAGYIVERALSFDNIFVFVVVFRYFGVPEKYQHRVLFYGIMGAFVFRAIFVAGGAMLMRFHWVVFGFGVLLLITGVRMLLHDDNNIDPQRNPVIRLLRRFLPVTASIRGPHFLVRQENVLYATPLLVALVFLEVTDVIFAIDSVPAVFALTREPLIVFTSNILAILGLRAMYFMLAGAMDKFHLLKFGLSAVLIFVGLKMTIFTGNPLPHVPVGWSLAIICLVLIVSITASLLFPKRPLPEVEQGPL
jgi:tellurite resistance protein TerC